MSKKKKQKPKVVPNHFKFKRAFENATPVAGSLEANNRLPSNKLPNRGMAPRAAYQLIHDDLLLDGSSKLNLATFVQTTMEEEADKLMSDCFDKNMIDKDEYPQTAEIEKRCVRIISRLWNAPKGNRGVGTSTVGSSEAAMLGGMAMKWNWRKRMEKQGKPTTKPNLVIGANAQICWKKFVRYWEIEPRFVPCQDNTFILTPEAAVQRIDENTIGVVAILGSTFDGSYEPVEKICDMLDKFEKQTGIYIPVHVDAASGGFVAPFLQPMLKWDFRLPRVVSINASGHKYGLVYPGVGWIIWRGAEHLPEELIFHVKYLGGDMMDFSINFSRPGSQVIAQYYTLIRLGFEGYQNIHQTSQNIALHLSRNIGEMDAFELITEGRDIPVFCWKQKKKTNFSLYDVADHMRMRGWLIPAYPMPHDRQDLVVQRIVVRKGLTLEMADILLKDMKECLVHLGKTQIKPKEKGSHFSH